MQFPSLSLPEIQIILVGVLACLAAGILYYLYKPRAELPLTNETDLGPWVIPLPDGIEEGRMTTAQRTFEKVIDIAISNANNSTQQKQLMDLRKDTLKHHLFAFKGAEKYFFFSNANLSDEKFSLPMGRNKRLLKPPLEFIDKGRHNGFRTVILKMPGPDATKMDAEEREGFSNIGEAIKYLRSAAMNQEKLEEANKHIGWLEDELDLTQKALATERSEKAKAMRALGQKPLTPGEPLKVKGPLRTQISEFFGSGWRVVVSAGTGLATYWIWKSRNLPQEPLVIAIIVGLVAFFVYPWIAERLE